MRWFEFKAVLLYNLRFCSLDRVVQQKKARGVVASPHQSRTGRLKVLRGES